MRAGWFEILVLEQGILCKAKVTAHSLPHMNPTMALRGPLLPASLRSQPPVVPQCPTIWLWSESSVSVGTAALEDSGPALLLASSFPAHGVKVGLVPEDVR